MFWIIAITSLMGLFYWLFMSQYSQIFGKFPYKINTRDRIVALTFDDGPNEPYTSQIVDFLDSKNIKATFFMVGKCVERYPDTAVKLHKFGHIIGNHGSSHSFYKYFSQLYFSNEIISTQKIIKKVTGLVPALFRPPWLWRHPLLLANLKKLGLKPVSGKFCYDLEVFQPSADLIAERTLKKVNPGSIIIFHDGFNSKGGDRHQTVKAVKIVVNDLLDKGYRFATIDELLNINPYQ